VGCVGPASKLNEGFVHIASEVAGLNFPSLLVQKVGYLAPAMGDNLASLIDGFSDSP